MSKLKQKLKHRNRQLKQNAAESVKTSRWNAQLSLRSRRQPGDSFSAYRELLDIISKSGGEYCGLPTPINGEKLILEPRHPAAKIYAKYEVKEPDDEGVKLVNVFYSYRHRCDIVIWRESDGKTDWGRIAALNHIKHDFSTMGCSVAWSLESEMKAQKTLGKMLAPHIFKMYLLTGMFPETSKRSGVTYIFRRLRPTVALRPGKTEESSMRILCALCLHPIGYYADTWAGSMCPTDDVMAHLLLMRGDEHMFWKRANQIPPHRPNAGL